MTATAERLPAWVRADLDDAVAAVRVVSARRAEVSGTVVDADAGGMIGGHAALANAVAEALYTRWYLRQSDPVPAFKEVVTAADLDLVAALRAAHAATRDFGPGGVVVLASDRGRVEVDADGRRRVLDRCDHVPVPATAAPAAPGTAVLATRRFDWIDAGSNAWWCQPIEWALTPGQRVTRWYWHARPDALGRVVGRLSTWLADVPYAIKVQTDAGALWRPDVIVLYVDPAGAVAREAELARLAVGLAGELDPSTPRLTRAVGPGVATADGAVGARSFGQVRCALVADALVGASLSGSDPTAAMIRRFELAGYDPARPDRDPQP